MPTPERRFGERWQFAAVVGPLRPQAKR
jgi:hypothetical protein